MGWAGIALAPLLPAAAAASAEVVSDLSAAAAAAAAVGVLPALSAVAAGVACEGVWMCSTPLQRHPQSDSAGRVKGRVITAEQIKHQKTA